MKNLAQAVQVAVFVRNYIRQNTTLDRPDSQELAQNYERISKQLKTISNLK